MNKKKLVWLLQKAEWCFLRKLKIQLPCDLAIPLLDTYPEELKSESQKDVNTPVFIAALLTVNTWTQPSCPLRDE